MTEAIVQLVLYSKPGCHLCEGLQEKLAQIRRWHLEVEVRDITTREEWFQAYQYEIPVLYLVQPDPAATADSPNMLSLPRLSPRASVSQLESLLQKYVCDRPQ